MTVLMTEKVLIPTAAGGSQLYAGGAHAALAPIQDRALRAHAKATAVSFTTKDTFNTMLPNMSNTYVPGGVVPVFTNLYVAQRVTPATSFTLNAVSLNLIRMLTGSVTAFNGYPLPVMNLLCQVYSNSANAPNALLGFSAATVNAADLPFVTDQATPTPDGSWTDFLFSPGIALTSGVDYWIALKALPSAIHDVGFEAFVIWLRNDYSGTADSTAQSADGAAWTVNTAATTSLHYRLLT